VKINVLSADVRPTPATDFRLLLQAELGRRCAGNPQYSLRAFAKFLALDHATLSQLLRGKRRLTARTIVKLGTRLGLSEDRIQLYCSHARREGPPAAQLANLREIGQMAHDTAALISDWHHYAILELTHLQEFRPDSRWIARVLGLTPDEVNVALTRLMRLGLLRMLGRERWVDLSGNTTASLADFAQVSIDRLARQVRGLLLHALQEGAPADCWHTSITLALPRARLAAVHERLARFQHELAALLDTDAVRDDVFQLEISLFPLTNLGLAKEPPHGTTGDAVADRGPRPSPGGGVLHQAL
jgi:uncharacterized protein (TIGR02147 family)